MSSAPSPRVFLSYLAGDSALANRLRDGLLRAGHDVQPSGSTRRDGQEKLILSADVVVVLATEKALHTRGVLAEIEAAETARVPIIPVLLDPAGVPPELVPYQGVQLRESSWDADVAFLAEQIARLARNKSVPFSAPRMLPPAPSHFFDRAELVRRIETALAMGPTDPDRPTTVQIVGPDGMGKTALAVHVAHRAVGRFPDGQLYAQLGSRADTSSVLRRFLEAMGVAPQDLPSSASGLAILYRSMLAGRRVLVVLDDVPDLTNVEALLPPSDECVTLLTSRAEFPPSPLHEHVLVVNLEQGLPAADALALLRATAGAAFVDDDPQRAQELVTAVQGSPLALALIGAQGRQRGPETLGALVAGLRALPEGAARQVLLDRVYETLPVPEKRLFRLFGALPAPEFETGLVAALAGTTAEEIVGPLQALVDAALVEPSGEGRYRLGELVATFAAGRLAADEPEDERRAAVSRAMRWMAAKVSFRPETPITRDFWTVDDKLGYAPYADAIASFIRHRGTLPPLTIGVTAPWGAGKTSLMRMIQQRLDPREDLEKWKPTDVRLSDDARKVLSHGLNGGPGKGLVTNFELLRHTSESKEAEIEASDLDADTPEKVTGDEWRPTVWFNPWVYQSGEQIWAGLAYEIISQITDRLSAGDRERFWLALNLRRVDRQALRRRIYRSLVERFLPLLLWFSLAVVLAVAGLLIALVVPPAADALRSVAAWLVSLSGTAVGVGAVVAAVRFLGSRASGSFGPLLRMPNPVKSAADQAARGDKGTFTELFRDPGYENRLGFLHLVHTDMRRVLDLVATRDRPLVVFVDDLDRCSPSAVVQVIEALNLFLAGEFPNCVFVLAMEPAVVAAHVEAVYKDLAAHPVVAEGSTLGWRFLEKIVQLPLSLPPPDAVRQSTGYLDSLLERKREITAHQAAAAPAMPSPPPAQAEQAPQQAQATPEPAPAAAPEQDREERVRLIVKEIWSQAPTIDTLAAAALEAQVKVVEGSDGTLLPETSEALNRVLVELYSDGEARTAIVAGVPGLASDNPREIKRFVNLFRFYTFIAQQHQLQGHPAVSGAEIAKLAVLAIRWPHLLGVLARRAGDSPVTTLSRLEQCVRQDGGDWAHALRDAGLTADEQNAAPVWATHLRAFLATQPVIADAANRML